MQKRNIKKIICVCLEKVCYNILPSLKTKEHMYYRYRNRVSVKKKKKKTCVKMNRAIVLICYCQKKKKRVCQHVRLNHR